MQLCDSGEDWDDQAHTSDVEDFYNGQEHFLPEYSSDNYDY